jgi:hypothetical protein
MKHTPDFVYLQAFDKQKYDRVNLRWEKPAGWSWSFLTDDTKSPSGVRFKQSLKMTFQGKYVQAKLINQNKQSFKRGKRSVITDFSQGSRGRLFDLFNKFEVKNAASFITLTYPDCSRTAREAKNNLRALFKRLERMYPKSTLSGVWRMEFQQRSAIHFHIVFFECPYVPKEELQKLWAEITNSVRPFTRVERIFSHKKIINYVAKYVGKVNPQGESSGFNFPTYLSAYQKYHGQEIGRVWGYLNKSDLPFAEEIVLELPLYWEKFKEFRRLAVAFFPRLEKNLSPGFKLYVPSAAAWEKDFHRLYDIIF